MLSPMQLQQELDALKDEIKSLRERVELIWTTIDGINDRIRELEGKKEDEKDAS